MIARRIPGFSLRLGRPEMSRLAWLILLSALIHAMVWGGYEVGKKLDLWDSLHWPAWLQQLSQKLNPKPPAVKPVEPEQPPLMFVDVSSDQATPAPPKDAKYYSAKNSQAANPDSTKDTDTPKIDGSQEHVAKTEDSTKHMADQLQPAQAKAAQEDARPQAKTAMGDLAMAKPDLSPQPNPGQAQQPRPRTLAEAEARQQSNQIPGQKMKQDAGVRRRNQIASLDAISTPFGAYDRALIDAIQSRWDDLLEARNYAGYQQGRVTLRFQLRYDGTISDMEVVESSVDTINSYLCEKAVTDPAPFEKWPSDMRREIGGETRTLMFSFFYN